MARILILEDDFDFADMMKIDLSEAGHSVDLVTNGSDALAHLEAEYFDLLIVDIYIRQDGKPISDGGLLLTGRLRNFPKRQMNGKVVGLPIIAISGAIGRPGQSNILRAAKSLGADAALAKPFEAEELRRIVSELLEDRATDR